MISRTLVIRITALFLLSVLCTHPACAQLFWNQAARFNGTPTSYIAIPNSPELDITGSFTIECWVKTTDLTSVPILVQHRSGGADEGYTLYLNAGRPSLRLNSITRLRSSTVIPSNRWTHIAAVYERENDLYVIYINGEVDTLRYSDDPPPASSGDSVRIGTGSFDGALDEVRIWRWSIETSMIQRHMRTSLVASGSRIGGLVLSLTFQDDESSGTLFSLQDWSGYDNDGVNRGVTAVDYSFSPPLYLSWNEGIYLDGSVDDYLAGPDAVAVSPVNGITIQAWVYPQETGTGVIVNKGLPTTTPSYRFFLTSGNVLRAGVNNSLVSATGNAPEGRWTHVAFTYAAASEAYAFYINGEPAGSGTLNAGSIADGPDSLLIGGGPSLGPFHGYLDEVRIAGYAKTGVEIRDMMYVTMDQANEQNSAQTNVCYSFNGSLTDACADGGPRLTFFDYARFSAPAMITDVPVAPTGRGQPGAGFPAGYRMRTSGRRIPATSTFGTMLRDSIYYSASISITDVNLFFAANHTREQDLEVALISPRGDSVRIFGDWGFGGADANIITIFDDDADSAYVSLRYMGAGPTLRPQYSMNGSFAGGNAQGWWTLDVRDDAASDTGRLYGWGIQINNQTVVGVAEVPDLPAIFRLAQNYPNPFNPVTVIEYDLPQTVSVTLEVFDILGRLIETPVKEVQPAGTYRVRFGGAGGASGTYLYRLRAGEFMQTRKMVLIK